MQKKDQKTGKLEKVICNLCKKEVQCKDGILPEGFFLAEAEFGYFSRKDGTRHRFDLCEDCYDKLTAQFLIPVEESDISEFV